MADPSFEPTSPTASVPRQASVETGEAPPETRSVSLSDGPTAGRHVANDGLPDRDLMKEIHGGSRRSLRVLFERYWSPLLDYSSHVVGSRDDAKDVVQDVFIRVWKRRGDWAPTGSVHAYLYRITRNLSLNRRRDESARAGRALEDGFHRSRSGTVKDPLRELEARSLRRDIMLAIDSLPDRQRETFVLSRFHGLSHREIAGVMDVSPQTVANQMTSALRLLRRELARHLPQA